MEDSDKSKIENLRSALYSRKIKIKPNFVLDLNGHKSEVSDGWQQEKKDFENISNLVDVEKKPRDFSKKIFWLAFVFFIISLVVAGYVYFRGGNIISANNINIEVIGSTTIKAGEETVLDISITNNNDTTLQIADLILEYPPGTRSAKDSVTAMTHDRVAFGDILPSQTVRRTVKAVFYGEEGRVAHVDMTLEYRVSTAMSVFTKESEYEVMIGSSPLTLSVEGLREVNANQDYTLTLNVVSNSDTVVKDVILTAELPFGYDVVSMTPNPEPNTTVWSLGDIESKGKRTIVVKGKMYGDHNEERFFKVNVGTRDTKNPQVVGGVISAVTQAVAIKQPFIGVALNFDRNDSTKQEYIAQSGALITGNFDIINNLDVPIYDVSIEVKATGPILVPNSQKASSGFYDSNTGVIRWNKTYTEELVSMLPNNTVNNTYTINTLQAGIPQTARINNPTITTDITVRAKRRLESGVPEDIISTIHRVTKVETNARISAQIIHNTGPIENEGGIPPVVGKKTDYTVMWAVTNTFNDLHDAKVTATLPDYVTWNNVIVGQGEKVTYNADSHAVTWDLGNVRAASGGKVSLRQVSFQISFVPSQSQVGTAPTLVSVANFTARDTFTDTVISNSSDILNTELPTDPLYKYEDSQVREY